MGYIAKVIRVFIASPDDVKIERGLVREAIYEWNSVNSFSRNIVLIPVGWETDAVANVGAPAQEEINKKVLENCDLLIGIFWSKVGMATESYPSGTIEEISIHTNAGKPAMLFFSKEDVPVEFFNDDQNTELESFKTEISHRCLYIEYESKATFRSVFLKQLSHKLLEEGAQVDTVPENILGQKSIEILKSNISGWSNLLDIEEMSNWISHLTSVMPYLFQDKSEQLENLTTWILSRSWGENQENFQNAFFKFRLILSDLLDVFFNCSMLRNDGFLQIEDKYHKIGWDPGLYGKLHKEYVFNVALIQDLATELCRATNYILDLYRMRIDPLFLINTGHIFVTTGPHYDLKFHYQVPLYEVLDSIPYENLDMFKTDRINRDRCMGLGKNIDDSEFLKWYQGS